MRNPTPRSALPTPNTGTIVGFVGFCEKVGEDIFWGERDDETQREVMIESLKADCEVRVGRPLTLLDTMEVMVGCLCGGGHRNHPGC